MKKFSIYDAVDIETHINEDHQTVYLSYRCAAFIIFTGMVTIGLVSGFLGIFGKFSTLALTLTIYVFIALLCGLPILGIYALYVEKPWIKCVGSCKRLKENLQKCIRKRSRTNVEQVEEV